MHMPKWVRRGLWAAAVGLVLLGIALAIVACLAIFWLLMNLLGGGF